MSTELISSEWYYALYKRTSLGCVDLFMQTVISPMLISTVLNVSLTVYYSERNRMRCCDIFHYYTKQRLYNLQIELLANAKYLSRVLLYASNFLIKIIL